MYCGCSTGDRFVIGYWEQKEQTTPFGINLRSQVFSNLLCMTAAVAFCASVTMLVALLAVPVPSS